MIVNFAIQYVVFETVGNGEANKAIVEEHPSQKTLIRSVRWEGNRNRQLGIVVAAAISSINGQSCGRE